MVKKEKVEEKVEVETVDPREAKWAAHLAKYEKSNPVKFASKKAKGEFNTIPSTFK